MLCMLFKMSNLYLLPVFIRRAMHRFVHPLKELKMDFFAMLFKVLANVWLQLENIFPDLLKVNKTRLSFDVNKQLILRFFKKDHETHSRPENLKKSRPKIFAKSILWIIFLAKFHFLQFQKWPISIFELGKSAQNVISRKKKLISRVFCPDFLKFSGLL